MCSTYSLDWAQTLGQSAKAHNSISSITFPVGILLDTIIASHICITREDFLGAVWRVLQYIVWWYRFVKSVNFFP